MNDKCAESKVLKFKIKSSGCRLINRRMKTEFYLGTGVGLWGCLRHTALIAIILLYVLSSDNTYLSWR